MQRPISFTMNYIPTVMPIDGVSTRRFLPVIGVRQEPDVACRTLVHRVLHLPPVSSRLRFVSPYQYCTVFVSVYGGVFSDFGFALLAFRFLRLERARAVTLFRFSRHRDLFKQILFGSLLCSISHCRVELLCGIEGPRYASRYFSFERYEFIVVSFHYTSGLQTMRTTPFSIF